MPGDDEKLKSLDDRIRDAQHKDDPRPSPGSETIQNPGMRAGSEFVAHVIAGALLGWTIDHFAGTTPVFIASMILLGFGLGIYRANKALTGK